MEATSTIDIQSLHLLCQQEKKEKESLKVEVMKLQLQLHKLTQIVFGSKSERFIPNPAQLTLDIKTEETPPICNISQAKKIGYVKTGTPKKRDLSGLSAYMEHLDHVYETREPENLPEGKNNTLYWNIPQAKFLSALLLFQNIRSHQQMILTRQPSLQFQLPKDLCSNVSLVPACLHKYL
jgi:hypothetical protein